MHSFFCCRLIKTFVSHLSCLPPFFWCVTTGKKDGDDGSADQVDIPKRTIPAKGVCLLVQLSLVRKDLLLKPCRMHTSASKLFCD